MTRATSSGAISSWTGSDTIREQMSSVTGVGHTINADVHAAQPRSTRRSPRTRRSLPGSRSLRSTPAIRCWAPTKLIHHAIRIAA